MCTSQVKGSAMGLDGESDVRNNANRALAWSRREPAQPCRRKLLTSPTDLPPFPYQGRHIRRSGQDDSTMLLGFTSGVKRIYHFFRVNGERAHQCIELPDGPKAKLSRFLA